MIVFINNNWRDMALVSVSKVQNGEEKWRGQIGKHTSELQSHSDLVCRLLLEKKKKKSKRKNKKRNKKKNK